MISLRRRIINDVVHSFCWCCRNKTGAWGGLPMVICGQHPLHMRTCDGIPTRYTLSWHMYRPFINYFLASKAANYPLALFQLFNTLQIATSDWSREEMLYAHSLMEKYYAE